MFQYGNYIFIRFHGNAYAAFLNTVTSIDIFIKQKTSHKLKIWLVFCFYISLIILQYIYIISHYDVSVKRSKIVYTLCNNKLSMKEGASKSEKSQGRGGRNKKKNY